jgi:RNA polymerase sigma-70 factor (ECF subfamily)
MRSDEELMVAYVAGDASAFRELFSRHAPTLQRVMRQQLRRPEDANDLVQQTFLQLHRARNDYRPELPLRPWLYTIALNLKREYFRKHKRQREHGVDQLESLAPGVPSQENESMAAQAVRFALERLPEAQREVIALHWFGGVPLPEVAEVVGASLSAVKVRAHRGYAAMRQILENDPGNPRVR